MMKIKKIVKYILLNTIYKIKYIRDYKKYRKSTPKQYILFGVPTHGNIGDHAILVAEHQFLNDIGVQSVFDVPIEMQNILINTLKKHIKKDDIIMITGGGFIGSQWLEEENMVRQVLKNFSNNKTIIFPSTIYYKNDEEGQKELNIDKKIYEAHKNLVICAREEITYKWIKKTYPNIKSLLIPDIVLYLKASDKKNKREKIALLCLRKDVEKSINDENVANIDKIVSKCYKIKYTDTVVKKRITEKNREEELKEKLEEFSNAEFIITDRLHGMIFAAITETPCIAIGNYNYKVKGVYEWIKKLGYVKFIENIDLLEENIKEVLREEKRIYSIEIKEKYSELKNVIICNTDNIK